MIRVLFRFLLSLALGGMLLVLAVNSFLARGQDFEVFWRAGRHVLEGEAVYSALRDGGFCFKYPPWMAPLFVPYAIFSPEVGGVLWRLTQWLGLLFVLDWCRRRVREPMAVAIPALSMWGIWQFCILQGQITPWLLACALGGVASSWGLTRTVWALTAKTFHAWILLLLPRIRPAQWVWLSVLSVSLSWPVVVAQGGVSAAWGAYREALLVHQSNLGGAFTGFAALGVRALAVPF